MLDIGQLNHALISTDEGNFADFAILAAKYGHSSDWLFPKDLPPRRAHDTLTHDLDHLVCDNGEREAIVQQLCLAPHTIVVAILSYNLNESQIARLKEHGILVFWGWQSDMIETLSQAYVDRLAVGPEE